MYKNDIENIYKQIFYAKNSKCYRILFKQIIKYKFERDTDASN